MPSPKLRAALALLATLILPACSTLQPRDFAKSENHFELDRYFTGHLTSYGVFETPGGDPKRTFTCDNHGTRQKDGQVFLHQDFKFSDGTRQQRDWKIRRVDDTHWDATANDMIGVARGEGQGNAFEWDYTITADRGNPIASAHVHQWLYLTDDRGRVLSRLVITKLGVQLFQVSEIIRPVR
jgi:hypothetical protein